MSEGPRRILVVDDQPEILEDYKRILCENPQDSSAEITQLEDAIFGDAATENSVAAVDDYVFALATASQGKEAISHVDNALSKDLPFSVVFMDVRMPPGISGVDAATEIRKLDPNVEIVIVTAFSDVQRDEIVKRLGGSPDKILYLRKPFDRDEIRQLSLALSEKWLLNKQNAMQTEQLKALQGVTIQALAELAEIRDDDTGSHLHRVNRYSQLIARKLSQMPEPKWCRYITERYIYEVGQASILHDIGKVGISDSVLLKPGKLTPDEFNMIKSHPTIGGACLANAESKLSFQSILTLAKEIAFHHHEKFDGSGYPQGLLGEAIPLSARIVALADVWDALTTDRPYRKAMSHEEARRIILEEMGPNHFDPIILGVFAKHFAEFAAISQEQA